MIPPVFDILKASTAVKALVGNNPVRVFPFGSAPQNVTRPYATYSVFNGQPENYLDQVPDIDNMGTQIDVWADSVSSCEAVSVAIRNALEPSAHMTSFSGNDRDPETRLFHCRMDFDFFEGR